MNPKNHKPLFTVFTHRFVGTLDYILYTVDSLSVEGLLELLDSESLGIGLLSPLWSSDHIALMASFRPKPCQPLNHLQPFLSKFDSYKRC